jgi:hypothetical protein
MRTVKASSSLGREPRRPAGRGVSRPPR